MENQKENLEKSEMMKRKFPDAGLMKVYISVLMEDARRKESEGLLTIEDCLFVLHMIVGLCRSWGLSSQDISPEINAVGKAIEEVPLFRKANLVDELVFKMDHPGEFDRTSIAESVDDLIKEGMTVEKIGDVVKRYLDKLENWELFSDLFEELEAGQVKHSTKENSD